MAITPDYGTKLIQLTSPHNTSLDMQDLINAIRDAEETEEGIQYAPIAVKATGKFDLGEVISDISITLSPEWQIKYPDGAYQAVMLGGQVIGGVGGIPVAYSAGVNVRQLQSSAGVIATVTSGSGLDAGQDTKLTRIHTLLDSIEGSLDHQEAMRLLLAAMAAKLSGADGTTVRVRDTLDSKDRIVATVDEHGNRTAVTLDAS